jgi:hypothetical protein
MDTSTHIWILEVIEQLRALGMKPGKTHVHKAMYLIAAASGADVPFKFCLYKYGPYSFDMEAALVSMLSYGALQTRPVADFGSELSPGPQAHFVHSRGSLPAEHQATIKRVCEFVNGKNIMDLEKLATAAWVRVQEGLVSSSDVARRMHKLKPHVTLEQARIADQMVQELLNHGA